MGLSLRQAVAAVLLPFLAQVFCVLVVGAVDPCNNNPGCMAGSITAYAVILVLPASLLVLVLVTLLEAAIARLGFKAALAINTALALAPFVLVLGALARHS